MATGRQSGSEKIYNINEALEDLLDSDIEFSDTEICMSSSEEDDGDDMLDYCERKKKSGHSAGRPGMFSHAQSDIFIFSLYCLAQIFTHFKWDSFPVFRILQMRIQNPMC